MRLIRLFLTVLSTLLLCLLLVSCTATPTPATSEATQTPAASPTIETAAQVSPTAKATRVKTATPAPTKPLKSVLVISWDGARAGMMYDWIADGALPHFAALAAQGVRAEYARSIDPSLTAAAHNSIATGSYPARTGIVSNSFHNPADAFYWYRRGFDEVLDQAEPVWKTASKAGLTTAALFFPGGSPTLPGQTADYTIGYGIRDAYSLQVTATLSLPAEAWQGDLPASYSEPYEGSFKITDVSPVYLYLVDSTDDSAANYDTVILSTERSVTVDSPRLKSGEWGQLVLMPASMAGADFLIQEIAQDTTPRHIKLFYSNVYHNTAKPHTFLKELNEKFGFFPAGADSYALEDGWITPEDDLYLLERQARWIAEVTAWVRTTYMPDLIFAWEDPLDAAGHSFLMKDPRQLNYSPETAEQYAGYMRRVAQIADEALGIMLEGVDLNDTTVMLVADHGMAPLHTIVYVNTILEQAGLLKLDKAQAVVVKESKAFAIVSGGAANVYINIAGHERDGFVPPEEYDQIQAQIVELLSALTDPVTGEKVFQHVYRHEELGPLGLDHINSGAVFAQSFPGYHLDGWRGNDFVFASADFYGQHGYDSSLPEMYAMFIAAGLGVPTGGQIIPPVRIVDYAPTIAYLLGFAPAPTVDGQLIPALTGAP